jgi:hypothetical protein
MLITSVLIIVFASKLKAHPLEHSKWGALILVFSIIGLGGLFGLIGGILALAYKPILVGAQPQYGAPQQQYGPSTPSGLPTTSTTIYYTNLPPMWKSGARKLAFLPQLRQTTKLAKLKPKSVFCFLETRFVSILLKTKKENLDFLGFNCCFQSHDTRKLLSHQKLDECSAGGAYVSDFFG